MANTSTLLELDQRLLECIGDWTQHPVTTAIAASTSLVSTHLQKYRSTADHFNDWWVYIDDYANIGESRKVSDDDGTNTLTVLSAFGTDGTNKATFRLTKYAEWAKRVLAINRAIEELYPNLYIPLDKRLNITGNILPPFRWSSSSALDIYSTTNLTSIAKTTTFSGELPYWGGDSSAKATASAAGGYLMCSSIAYPRLLDLMNRQVTFKCWAYPQTANDATLVITTIKADGTTQTLTSTTTCPALKWTLLKLENQNLNDDLVTVQIKMVVGTINQYVYFSQPRVTGMDVSDYLVPRDFENGRIDEVYIQASGSADDACDDLNPIDWQRVFAYDVYNDGTYKYLSLDYPYSSESQIRIVGSKPMEAFSSALTSGSETLSLAGHQLNILTEYAAFRLFEILKTGADSQDRDHYRAESAYHYAKYQDLVKRQGMVSKQTMRLRAI